MKQRIEIVDYLRGVASLSVCWFHMTNRYPGESTIRASGAYGWLGVEVFFVISGFIICYALHKGRYKVGKHWATFVKKRIIRIDPPYIVAAALVVFLWCLSAFIHQLEELHVDLSFMRIILHLGYLNAIFDYPWLNPVFWTLAIEFQFYLLLSVMFPLFSSTDRMTRTVGVASIFVLAFVFNSEVFVFKYLCLFAVGIVTFQYLIGITHLKEYLLILGVSVVFLYLTLGLTICIVGTITALFIAFVRIRKTKLLSFLGAISYSLYLVHIPTGGRVINRGLTFADTELEYFLVSLSGVLVSIFFAYLLFRFVEKPAQAWSSRIRYKE